MTAQSESSALPANRRMPTYCMAPYTAGLLGPLQVTVPCQRERGHEGPHRYEVVWVDPPAPVRPGLTPQERADIDACDEDD